MNTHLSCGLTRAAVLIAALLSPLAAVAAIDFYQLPPIRQIALPPDGGDALLLATPVGVVRLSADGTSEALGLAGNDVTLLAADPGDPRALLASGRKNREENLGLLRSTDGGREWQPYSPGARQPVAYAALAASLVEPRVLYAYYNGVQVSTDGGESWQFSARGPWDVWALAGSARDPSTLYAAERGGLQRSTDGGQHWQHALDIPNAATALATTPAAAVYAFVIGRGLIRSYEPVLSWRTVNNRLGEQAITQLLLDPARPRHMFALTHLRRIIESDDGGLTWSTWGGEREPQTDAARRGLKLFREHCVACHGERGVGETPREPQLADPDYLRAPALNDSTHAWHHDDDDLEKDILEGSEREPRMRAHKDEFSKQDARDVVAYIKSLWGPKALSCQGQRHMAPECRR